MVRDGDQLMMGGNVLWLEKLVACITTVFIL